MIETRTAGNPVWPGFLGWYRDKMRYRMPSALALFALALQPSDGLGFSVCLFQKILALDCPVCGLTRSMSSLLHLEIMKSLSYHALGFLALGFLFLCLITNRPNYFRDRSILPHVWGSIVLTRSFLLILLVAVWLLKII